MSKSSVWGVAVSVFFGVFAQIAPIPETWRWPITWVAGAALLISCVGWFFSYFTKQLKVTLVPWWGAPQQATIVNRNPDYPAHVKRSTLYGVRWFRRKHLYEASNFNQCRRAPFTIEPGRQIEQAYGGYIPFDQFKFLQAKIELENGKVFVSKKAKCPTPPRDKTKLPIPKEVEEEVPDDPQYAAPRSESPQLKERRQKLKNLVAKRERLAAAQSSPGFDMDAARCRNEKFIAEVREDIERLESEPNKSALDARVTYEETNQVIEIFKNAPRVKVAVTSLSVLAGEEFRTVMEQAGWFCKALQDAGVNAKGRFWETLDSLPDGTNIWWKKTAQNNDIVERIIRAAAIKGLHPTEVQRPVSADDSEIELMIGRNPT